MALGRIGPTPLEGFQIGQSIGKSKGAAGGAFVTQLLERATKLNDIAAKEQETRRKVQITGEEKAKQTRNVFTIGETGKLESQGQVGALDRVFKQSGQSQVSKQAFTLFRDGLKAVGGRRSRTAFAALVRSQGIDLSDDATPDERIAALFKITEKQGGTVSQELGGLSVDEEGLLSGF